MPEIQQLRLIDISAPAADACCGPDGCACGSVDEAESTAGPESLVTEDFEVEGMTCEHCVSAVAKQVGGIAGVESVGIELVPGGRSTVTVGSAAPIDAEAVRAAVEEAGYALV